MGPSQCRIASSSSSADAAAAMCNKKRHLSMQDRETQVSPRRRCLRVLLLLCPLLLPRPGQAAKKSGNGSGGEEEALPPVVLPLSLACTSVVGEGREGGQQPGGGLGVVGGGAS